MLGAFSVGKTSLVRRFVKSIFDERYLTTVGVKVDKKVVRSDEQDVTLMLWDLQGQDTHYNVKMSYVRGASGYLLVVDGTRRETLKDAKDLRARVEDVIGDIPHLLLLNKIDLTESWELDEEIMAALSASGLTVARTSAKTGEGVEEAFQTLTKKMLAK
jgi:small GTP-binding protein